MNYQFFGTAGVVSCFLIIIIAAIVLFDAFSDVYVDEIIMKIAFICFISIIAFWIAIGLICWLNQIWGWGLVR